MIRIAIISVALAMALTAIAQLGLALRPQLVGNTSDLSPKVPAVFEWNEHGVERCEAWYPPPSAYYISCAEVGERQTLETFRRHAGPPPREMGFPPVPNRQ